MNRSSSQLSSPSRRRGMAPMQAVLLLGSAFFVIAAIKAFFQSEVMPQAEPRTREVFDPRSKPQGAATGSAAQLKSGSPASFPPIPAGGADRAGQRLAELGGLTEEKQMAIVAYPVPSDLDGNAEYFEALEDLEKEYIIHRPANSTSGFESAIFIPKQPGKPTVFAIAGSNDWKDWTLVNPGQLLPSSTTEEALLGVAGGLASLNPWKIFKGTTAHTLNQVSKWQYDNSLTIARQLIKDYGIENVKVVGHSLGGGIANYIAAMLGVRGFGFNSARLGQANLEAIGTSGVPPKQLKMTHVNAEGEFVSNIPAGKQLGEVITVGGKDKGWFSSVWNHSIYNVDPKEPVRYQPWGGK